MKKTFTMVFFTMLLGMGVSLSATGQTIEARVDTNHWYPDTKPPQNAEYEIELTIWGTNESTIASVTGEGPNVPVTSLQYKETLDTNEWRWYANVNLPSKPLVGDTYTFTITNNDLSTGTMEASVRGVIEEFPSIISPVHESTITTETPLFAWTPLSTELSKVGIIVADPEFGNIVWYGEVSPESTSAVYNFDGNGEPLQPGNNYIWILEYRDALHDNGAMVMSTFTLSVDDGVKEDTYPCNFNVVHNYPNPFNSSTTIEFALPSSTFTSLVIYNIAGQKVRELVSEYLPSGTHNTMWDGKDSGGNIVSSGTYIAQLKAGNYAVSKRMTFMK